MQKASLEGPLSEHELEYNYTECNNVYFNRDGRVHLKWLWSKCKKQKFPFGTNVSGRKAIRKWKKGRLRE